MHHHLHGSKSDVCVEKSVELIINILDTWIKIRYHGKFTSSVKRSSSESAKYLQGLSSCYNETWFSKRCVCPLPKAFDEKSTSVLNGGSSDEQLTC